MSGIKKLAGQTIWYGASSIAARFINYLLTPLLTYNLATGDFGKMGLIYSAIPILNVIFTYGFETAYFRFASKDEYKQSVYSTAALSLFFTTILLTALLWFNQHSFAAVVQLQEFPTIIQLSIFIIALDALSTIPFARLRERGRPKKFAFIKITGILFNIIITWFFVKYCPDQLAKNPGSWVKSVYDPGVNPVVYVILANLIQSALTLLLLAKEILLIRFRFNWALWRQMMIYSLPLIIVGMAGMVNETFDRLMLMWWLPGAKEIREQQVGIYNACYKLSILITLFIQAFRLGAEPFFFKQAEGQNPQRTYARVMKFFVIIIAIMFLVVSLFMPIWKYFIGDKYWEGLAVVPVLLLANMFLGIYYNLSVWYKLTNKNLYGAYITIGGAVITILLNVLLIPWLHYTGAALATFCCYLFMMLSSYKLGQKHYPIPYPVKKLTAYIVLVLMLYLIHLALVSWVSSSYAFSLGTGVIFFGAFAWFVGQVEAKDLVKLPVIGRFIRYPKTKTITPAE